MSYLTCHSIQITIDNTCIVNDVSLDINQGEIVGLSGPSGCGKTSILRAIAGFNPISHGEISLNGQTLSSSNSHTPPQKRNIGIVFQDPNLFPHMTVQQNIIFGLHTKKDIAHARCHELLQLIKLESKKDAYPHELSGGQQQRVAIARALAPKPSILLMDEPFSNLDASLKKALIHDLKNGFEKENVTVLMVSHDNDELEEMCHRTRHL